MIQVSYKLDKQTYRKKACDSMQIHNLYFFLFHL